MVEPCPDASRSGPSASAISTASDRRTCHRRYPSCRMPAGTPRWAPAGSCRAWGSASSSRPSLSSSRRCRAGAGTSAHADGKRRWPGSRRRPAHRSTPPRRIRGLRPRSCSRRGTRREAIRARPAGVPGRSAVRRPRTRPATPPTPTLGVADDPLHAAAAARGARLPRLQEVVVGEVQVASRRARWRPPGSPAGRSPGIRSPPSLEAGASVVEYVTSTRSPRSFAGRRGCASGPTTSVSRGVRAARRAVGDVYAREVRGARAGDAVEREAAAAPGRAGRPRRCRSRPLRGRSNVLPPSSNERMKKTPCGASGRRCRPEVQ